MVNQAAPTTDESVVDTGSIIAGAIAAALVVGAVTLAVFRRRVATSATVASVAPSGRRLTSDALRRLDTPTWRVVHELPDDVLGGIDHVLIGPIGVVAIVTRLSPLPPTVAPGDAHDRLATNDLAASAVARAELDDALATVGMRSEVLVDLHWGRNDRDEAFVEIGRDHLAVDGRRIEEWLDVPEPRLTPTLVDHAWSTIVTAVGRPDPLRTAEVRPDRTR